MTESRARFPDGFLWGVSTAGHQVEGGNVNADMWTAEWAPDSIFAEPSGDACDHYHRYPEDIALLAELGFNTFRFSLEWARIEPEDGWFSRAALDHYRRVIGTCMELGVTPMVTYSHFTTPRWFAARGGWASPDAAERFGRFAARATEHLGDLLEWVATLNEPNLMSLLEHTGKVPMGTGTGAIADDGSPSYRLGFITHDIERMSAVHRAGVEAIKSHADLRVGWTLALVDLQPGPGGEQRWTDALQGAEYDWLDVSRDDDWVGVQTYSREVVGPDGALPVPDGVPTMQAGSEVYPEALGHSVRLAAERTGVPVLVTENGMATDDDEARIAYTRAALEGLASCVADGVDVRGYLHWSFLDNFEWTAGFAPTYGLVAFDPDTFARKVKPSARWLGEVARANALGR